MADASALSDDLHHEAPIDPALSWFGSSTGGHDAFLGGYGFPPWASHQGPPAGHDFQGDAYAANEYAPLGHGDMSWDYISSFSLPSRSHVARTVPPPPSHAQQHLTARSCDEAVSNNDTNKNKNQNKKKKNNNNSTSDYNKRAPNNKRRSAAVPRKMSSPAAAAKKKTDENEPKLQDHAGDLEDEDEAAAAEDSDGQGTPQRLRRGRAAASRCRRKKKAETDKLAARERRLEAEHTQLTTDATALREEVLGLKHELLRHAACDSALISAYLENEARGVPGKYSAHAQPAPAPPPAFGVPYPPAGMRT